MFNDIWYSIFGYNFSWLNDNAYWTIVIILISIYLVVSLIIGTVVVHKVKQFQHSTGEKVTLKNIGDLITPIHERREDDYINELLSEGFKVNGYVIKKGGINCYAGEVVSNGIDIYRAVDRIGNMKKIGHTSRSNFFNYVMNDDILIRGF